MRVTLGRDVAVCVVITAAPRRAARACLHALRSRRAPRQSALSFAGRGVPQLADLAEFVPSLQDGSHTPRQDRGLRCQPHRRRGRRRLACRVQRGRAFARGVSHDRREASRAEHSLVTARKRRLRQPARCTCATLSLPKYAATRPVTHRRGQGAALSRPRGACCRNRCVVRRRPYRGARQEEGGALRRGR